MQDQQQGMYDTANQIVQGRNHQPTMYDDGNDLLNVLLSKDEIIKNKAIPDGLKEVLTFYTKTLAISNMNQEDLNYVLRNFRDVKVAYLMSRPKHSYTWREELLWTVAKSWLRIEGSRGVNGFERRMQATQILSNTNTLEQKTPTKGLNIPIIGRFL